MPWLINATQLEKFRKSQKNVVIFDATWYLPSETGNALEEYKQRHIPSARFLDLNLFADKNTPLPNMLTRDEKKIAELLGALGITNEYKIIFYDNSKHHTSCRALWMFKVFGHNPNQLYILDSNLDTWERNGGKIESGEPRITPKTYTVNYSPQYLRTLVQMKANLHHPSEQVVDVRNAVRYAGGKESRPGMRAGHMPNSFSFPFTTMFDTEGNWKPIERIRRQLSGVGVELTSPIITSCGSGTTAPILNFALDLMNIPNHALYDGSWSEWGADKLYDGEKDLTERPVISSLDT